MVVLLMAMVAMWLRLLLCHLLQLLLLPHTLLDCSQQQVLPQRLQLLHHRRVFRVHTA